MTRLRPQWSIESTSHVGARSNPLSDVHVAFPRRTIAQDRRQPKVMPHHGIGTRDADVRERVVRAAHLAFVWEEEGQCGHVPRAFPASLRPRLRPSLPNTPADPGGRWHG